MRNAWKRALRCLSMEGEFAHLATNHPTETEGSKYPLQWIGNEREMLFELVAYFFYEFPTKEDKSWDAVLKVIDNFFYIDQKGIRVMGIKLGCLIVR